jgi:ABC-type nitrate/sulfonate/bicarbonate transport system permease component
LEPCDKGRLWAAEHTGVELVESGELQRDILASLSRVLQGFAIAAFAGVTLGMAVGRSRVLESLVDPTLKLLRPIPPLAFLPMMVLWFGIGGQCTELMGRPVADVKFGFAFAGRCPK